MPSVHPDLSTTAPRPTTATSADNAALTSSASSLAAMGSSASPTDVLLTLPPPFLRLLVVSAPFVQFLTTLSQLLTWTHPNRYASFLLPLFWTAVCLGGEWTARFGFNALILAILGVGWVAKRGGKVYTSAMAREKENSVKTLALATASQPAVQVLTPTALNTLLHQSTILSKHLQVLVRTFSPLLTPFTWRDPAISFATINLLLTSYPFYLLLTYFVPLRHIVLLIGLVGLTWEAPWFAVIRRALRSSVLVRRTGRVILRVLQGDLRFAASEAKGGPEGVGLLANLKMARSLTVVTQSTTTLAMERGRSKSGDRSAAVQSKDAETLEIQYLFTIFENQRWWIGLEWTQALLPNERPSWSDPTHAPSSPPGAFILPAPTSVSNDGSKRTFTWKWVDPEWRIRGTAGVFISPSTIGANANPPVTAPSTLPGSTKDLKDAMSTLGDWKNRLGHRSHADETKERRGSFPSSEEKSPTSGHSRKGSIGLIGDGISSLIGAKDGKPVTKSDEKQRRDSETSRHGEVSEDDEMPGHPRRMDEPDADQELEVADWTVDSQGWVYADNHWEKPSSKGGMGRYTRRRAWVRRAIVVERIEPL